ncbi:hypothetical protein E8E12_001978 [Didymella heteroderae]|uniref:Nephrocystin 3-like N-terminal domain-containing protein n=1 Tax=Didymella heteroderae TaxID=1769908 RepID=A0A9P4WIC0_9PLEO|nr:hypothetical protein E8E12_001978 [Didymella heteroderae]
MPALEIMGGVASAIALLDTCTKIYEYIKTVKGATKDQQRFRESIEQLIEILKLIRNNPDDPEVSITWAATIDTIDRSGRKQALLWPFTIKDVKKMMTEIERSKSSLMLAFQVIASKLLLHAISVGSSNTNSRLGELRDILPESIQRHDNRLDDVASGVANVQVVQIDTRNTLDALHQTDSIQNAAQKKEKILQLFSPIDHASRQSDVLQARQPGTGQWLFRKDLSHAWEKTAGSVLFCPGVPGAGKTVMTSIVIDHLLNEFGSDSTVGVAFIYCEHQRCEQQTPESLISSLLKQLAQQAAAIPPAVRDLHYGSQFNGRQQQPKLEAIYDALVAASQCFSRTFILVDILDECGSQKTLSELSRLFTAQQIRPFNVLVTSRRLPDIEELFAGHEQIEIRADEHDVEAYLNQQMTRLPNPARADLHLHTEIHSTIIALLSMACKSILISYHCEPF